VFGRGKVAEEQAASKKQAVITVNLEWCKGCEICVAFCPEGVLEMKGGKVQVVRPEECTKCMLCELRCPDFAITVE
jgi:2-oxoglutarate ferredoxin oxidoreductase subunit delta